MPDGEGIEDAAVQGRAEPIGNRVSGNEAALLLGISRSRPIDPRSFIHARKGSIHLATLLNLWATDDRPDLLILQDDGPREGWRVILTRASFFVLSLSCPLFDSSQGHPGQHLTRTPRSTARAHTQEGQH